MKYVCAKRSDRGRKYSNFDELLVYKGDVVASKFHYFILSDGVGSAELSAEAAQIAVNTVDQKLQEGMTSVVNEPGLETLVSVAVDCANQKIIENNKLKRQEMPSLKPGASTIDVGILYSDALYIAHVGDGRIYVLDNENSISLITRDENSAFADFKNGFLKSTEEIKVHPGRKKIKNALGIISHIKIKMYSHPLEDIRTILAATDGLYCSFTDKELEEVLKGGKTPNKIIEELFIRAKHPVGIIPVYQEYCKREENRDVEDDIVREELTDDNLTAIVLNKVED